MIGPTNKQRNTQKIKQTKMLYRRTDLSGVLCAGLIPGNDSLRFFETGAGDISESEVSRFLRENSL